jgi:predicted nucleic acid-binding protein
VASFLPDTSCMIAAISSWHEHHEQARREIESRLSRKQRMIVAGPALIESYSVLTRFPSPHRIAPADARSLLVANFLNGVQVVALAGAAYGSLLRGAPKAGISGGRTYDAVIVACARKAGVTSLLTMNEKHFAPFAGDDLEIIVP